MSAGVPVNDVHESRPRNDMRTEVCNRAWFQYSWIGCLCAQRRPIFPTGNVLMAFINYFHSAQRTPTLIAFHFVTNKKASSSNSRWWFTVQVKRAVSYKLIRLDQENALGLRTRFCGREYFSVSSRRLLTRIHQYVRVLIRYRHVENSVLLIKVCKYSRLFSSPLTLSLTLRHTRTKTNRTFGSSFCDRWTS